MPGMSRWTLVVPAPAILLAGDGQADPVSGSSFTDRITTSGASYAYTVHTLDAVGNESGASNVVSLTLGGKSGGPKGGGGGDSGGGQGGGKGQKK